MHDRDFYDDRNYYNDEEARRKLLKKRVELSSSITNRSEVKLIDSLLNSVPNDAPEEVCAEAREDVSNETKLNFKEKFSDSLGCFGAVLYIFIKVIIAVLPFVMIGGNFFLTLLLISINTFVPFASAVFWIWGLVCAIKGVQDIWAIMFYIAFVLIWIPFYIKAIAALFSKD